MQKGDGTMRDNFPIEEPQLYKDNIPPNINPKTGYRLHKTYLSNSTTCYHTHEYYEIFMIMNGLLTHCVNGSKQVLTAGHLVFIRPFDKHFYVTSKAEYINFAFNRKHADVVFYHLDDIYDIDQLVHHLMPPTIRLSSHEMDTLLKKFDIINSIPRDNIIEQKIYVRNLLLDIISKFFYIKTNETNSEIPLWLIRTYNEMQKPENFISGIGKMAEISKKTPEHLSRTLKKYYNVTPSQLVTELRLNYAVNLITNTNMKIIDICFESGFGNLSNFYNVFKAVYCMTPQQFRKNQTDSYH